MSGALKIVDSNGYVVTYRTKPGVSDRDYDIVDPVDVYDKSEIDNINLGTTFTKTFLENEDTSIAIPATPSPSISVTKEVPQVDVTTDAWLVNPGFYEREDFSYDTTITPSGTNGSITLSLGVGSFSASDVNNIIYINDGEVILTNIDGSAEVRGTSYLTDTTISLSGEWVMNKTMVDANGDTSLSGISLVGDFNPLALQQISTYSVPIEPTGATLSSNGSKLYVLDGLELASQYTLSTPFDVSTAVSDSKTFNFSTWASSASTIQLSDDGTKVYLLGSTIENFVEFNLSTPYDISTAVLVFSYAVGGLGLADMTLSSNGQKLYILHSAKTLHEYTLATPFSAATVSEINSIDVSSILPGTATGLAVSPDGLTMFISETDNIFKLDLSIAWNVTTAVYNGVFKAFGGHLSIFSPDVNKLYSVIYNTVDSIQQYKMDTYFEYVIDTYVPSITNSIGQIDSTYWTDINSLAVTETLNGESAYYAVSTDNRTTWAVIKTIDGVRNIVRNNAGIWEYNTNITYSLETWTVATINSEYQALAEAMTVALNLMTSVQAEAVGDAEHYTLGNTIDLAYIIHSASSSVSPSVDGMSINYDGNIKNEGCVHGVDYTYEQPAPEEIMVKSLANNNLKIRIF